MNLTYLVLYRKRKELLKIFCILNGISILWASKCVFLYSLIIIFRLRPIFMVPIFYSYVGYKTVCNLVTFTL